MGLDITDCPGVTEVEIIRFKNEHPFCSIIIGNRSRI